MTLAAAASVFRWTSLSVGVVEIVLALVVARHLASFGRRFPWLAALTVYFATRGAARLYVAAAGREPEAVALGSDALLALVLVLATATLDRTVRALRTALDEAAIRAGEYARALEDYRRLARHRLANPLTVVGGAVETLRLRRHDLDGDEIGRLLDAMQHAVADLERISLAPGELRPEEHGLRPLLAAGESDGRAAGARSDERAAGAADRRRQHVRGA